MGTQILAIASLTLKEAIRRRTFLLVVVFGVALISSAAFFPTLNPEDILALIVMWASASTAFFGAVVGIFVAGTSLPTEFRQRRIFNLVSKPIRKSAVFLGRFVGFSAALAIYTLMTAVISLLYIRAVAWRKDLPPPIAEPRTPAAEFAAFGQTKDDPANERKIVGQGYLSWRFDAPASADFAESVPATINVAIHSGYEYSGNVLVRVVGEGDQERWRTPGDGIFVSTNVSTRFEIPRDALTRGGPVEVQLRATGPDYTIYATGRSLELIEQPASFELNLLKGFSMIFLQSVILMAASLAASAWVSAPVSMLVGIALWIFGAGYGQFEEGVRSSRATIKHREQLEREGERGHGHKDDLPQWVLEYSSDITGTLLKVLPNFNRIDPTDDLIDGVDISARRLGRRWVGFAPYWIFPVVIGVLLMRLREFA